MKLSQFEKKILKSILLFSFSSIVLSNLALYIIISNTTLAINSQHIKTIITVVLALFLLLAISSYWMMKIIRRDKASMYSLLGVDSSDVTITEFDELNNIYLEKLKSINLLNQKYNEQKEALRKLHTAVSRAQYNYKEMNNELNAKKNELEGLKEFFKKASEKFASMIWITDYQGNIIYTNDLTNKNLDGKKEDLSTIFDILDISTVQFDLFRKRNFQSMLFHFVGGKKANGRNLRIFDKESIKYILFLSATSNQESIMNRTYLKKSRDLHFINEISKIISGQITIDTTLQDAIEKIAFLGNYNSCSIRLINESDELELKAVSGYSKEFVMRNHVPVANSHIGYAFNENKIVILNTLEDMLFEDSHIKNVILNNRKVAYIPLTNYNKNLGVMAIVSDYNFDSESIILLESISINVTIALEKILLYDRLKSNYFKTVEAFVTATDIKSERFNGHSRRVALICKMIAEKLYLNSGEVDEIYMAGLLHDVGKLSFSDNSLDYYFDIDQHGSIGRKMVERVGLKKDILDGIEYHHLNFDLSNSKNTNVNEQPYYAQIIRIANDFDLYMNYDTTNINLPNFIEDMKPLVGSVYSSQFMRIMQDILVNNKEKLYKIYQNEVIDEKQLL
ncbi:HD domain-containing protein [Fusibacter bizertensis]|uniref:HD domain-containing protein n=2 Tax=Fusibacter bizertensis TaxID=1488331 RepID=A0ABT6NFI8_9FIRM|nr:HD domain-containing protein [Fusibacter bizertensis]